MDDDNFLLDKEPQLPGSEVEFRDVTSLFLEAASGKSISYIFKDYYS